jgi:hypothetical protein
MVDQLSIKDDEIFEIIEFDKKITQQEIEAFLTESILILIQETLNLPIYN